MAAAIEPKTPGSTFGGSMRRSVSSTTLRKTGEAALGNADEPPPHIPKYLDVHSLTRRRKLSASTGNLHGFMAEDYSQINWPLPKMFGNEKYAYTLIDIDDPRYIKECAQMSKRLIHLQYDQQITDLEWRKVYRALLDSEHRQATLPKNCQEKTRSLLKKEVDGNMKRLLELQEKKDAFEREAKEIYNVCDGIKATIKKEDDLEKLRKGAEKATKERMRADNPCWGTKFNIKSQFAGPRSGGVSFDH